MNDSNMHNCQYNSCTHKGICSTNPKTAALQNVLILYLYLIAEYCLKLLEKNKISNSAIYTILKSIVVTVSYPEFSELIFWRIVSLLKDLLPKLIQEYNLVYSKKDFEGENIFLSDIFKRSEKLVDAIRLGEDLSREFSSKYSIQILNLYKMMMVIAKNISLNILEVNSFDKTNFEGFENILEMLITINHGEQNAEKIKNIITEATKINTKIILNLRKYQEKNYGLHFPNMVSHTTTPSKAILVAGAGLKELEIILEGLKDTNIDIYTHGELILAYTFPKFNQYKNLKGQYGYGLDKCLIDFATFPGPIIFTKYSLYNIENFYRGRLYTTDENSYQGIIPINNYDFSEIIKVANEMKGFKKGRECEIVKIGYNEEEIEENIKKALNSNLYKNIVVIGEKNFCNEQTKYFEKLIDILDNTTLIISHSYNSERNNLIYINSCFDNYRITKTLKLLEEYSNLPTSVFLPICTRNTISESIYSTSALKFDTYLGECFPILLNISLKDTLNKAFGIKPLTSPKSDKENLFKFHEE